MGLHTVADRTVWHVHRIYIELHKNGVNQFGSNGKIINTNRVTLSTQNKWPNSENGNKVAVRILVYDFVVFWIIKFCKFIEMVSEKSNLLPFTLTIFILWVAFVF